MALSSGHKHIARLFLAKGILEEKELENEVDVCNRLARSQARGRNNFQTHTKEIENVLGCGLRDDDLEDIVQRIKTKMLQIGLTIEEIVYPMPEPRKYYGLRATVVGDKISEFSVDFDVKLVKLFQRLVNAACEERGYIQWRRIQREYAALNEEHQQRATSKKNTLQVSADEVRSFLNKMLEMRWLAAFRGIDRENGELVVDVRAVFTLGPRSMCDLRQYIDDRGDDLDIDACSLCQEVCWLRGSPCPHPRCRLIMHEHCVERYNRLQCPLCQQGWDHQPEVVDLFGEKYSESQESAALSMVPDDIDVDEEDSETGVDVSSHMDSAFDTPARPIEDDDEVLSEAVFSEDSDFDME